MPSTDEIELGSLWLQNTGAVRILVSGGLDLEAARDLAALLLDMIRTADRALGADSAGKAS
jgi:hypothetical protein